mmetsp:Transcript_102389/g.305801  ORF Transcript_102389/g.305801 Transcript_102389/m.305801 type:complete len:216 (+) Transcript_102389:3-650(+)
MSVRRRAPTPAQTLACTLHCAEGCPLRPGLGAAPERRNLQSRPRGRLRPPRDGQRAQHHRDLHRDVHGALVVCMRPWVLHAAAGTAPLEAANCGLRLAGSPPVLPGARKHPVGLGDSLHVGQGPNLIQAERRVVVGLHEPRPTCLIQQHVQTNDVEALAKALCSALRKLGAAVPSARVGSEGPNRAGHGGDRVPRQIAQGPPRARGAQAHGRLSL